MQHIETVTLSTSQSSITFSAIPQDFTDLVLLTAASTNRTSVNNVDALIAEFNGVTTGYSRIALFANGVGGVNVFTGTTFQAAFTSEFENGANTRGNSSLYISNYTTAQPKSGSADSCSEANTDRAGMNIIASLWNDTAAITSMKLLPQNGTLIQAGSTISLYGITAGSDGTTTVS